MIDIKHFGKRKNGSTNTGRKSGGYAATTASDNNGINGVNIWGQFHDHSGDVDGDLTANGNITSTGTVTASQGQINGDLGVSGNTTIDHNLTVSGNGDFGGTITGDDLTLGGDIHCVDINCENIDCSNEITTEYLTVTKQAHFFNLTIDEIKSVGGQIILSAANATIDHVEQNNGQWLLAWKYEDGEKGINNQFKVNDQVICQTFNETTTNGTSINTKYYWAVVTMVGSGSYIINGENCDCHYIVLSSSQDGFDGQSEPAVGDKICQLGYRGTDDPQRQSAIILSAYRSPDPNVTAPSIVQYEGINSFHLDGCITNQLAHGENVFTGNFKVVNNGTTTDVVDLIQGQHPQVLTDSQQAWAMADSNGKTYYFSDYQNLPTVIHAYLGSEIIPYSEWVTGSQIKYKNTTYRLTGTTPAIQTRVGLGISSITRNTNDVTINWRYSPNEVQQIDSQTGETTTINSGTTETNNQFEITVKFTHNGTTYTVSKNVPINVIKASETTQGADAEIDKLMVDKLDLTVTLDNKLTCNVNAKVFHVKGNKIEQLTDLSNYTANILLSNNQTVSLSKSTYFYRTANISNSYSSMTNPPTSAILRLLRNGTVVDTIATPIKFDAGSIFTITENAITSAVAQSQTYTDGQITTVNANISQIEQTANSISSRVTAIENDYITQSELTQTANNIQLNVYDELRNKTGIDVSQGTITLNAENTTIVGNLNLTDTENGLTVFDVDGTPRIQIQPANIGSVDDYDTGAVQKMNINNTATNVTKYTVTTDKTKVGEYLENDVLKLSDYTLWLFAMNANKSIAAYPTASTGTMKIEVFQEGNNTALKTYNYTISKVDNTGHYRYTGTTNYTIPTKGVYLLKFTLTVNDSVASGLSVFANAFFTISHKVSHQTFVGLDGFVSNPETNCLFWAGSEEIQMRWKNAGLRVNDYGLQTIVGSDSHNGTVKPTWLSMWNYTPIFWTGASGREYSYQLLNKTNQYRWAYQLQPLTDVGICFAVAAHTTTNIKQPAWVILPNSTFTNDRGETCSLPLGYSITIINESIGSDSVTVYVVPPTSDGIIYDDNRNDNNYCELSGAGKCSDTFIYMGNNVWRQLKDTQ